MTDCVNSGLESIGGCDRKAKAVNKLDLRMYSADICLFSRRLYTRGPEKRAAANPLCKMNARLDRVSHTVALSGVRS